VTTEARVERLDVSVHRVPTESLESDGTIEWDSTTVVVVQAHAGGKVGVGYTYSAAAAAGIVHDQLAGVVVCSDALAVGELWHTMGAALRNVGRPGVAMCAVSAVDSALWDLKARLLGVPLVDLLPPLPRRSARLRKRRLHLVRTGPRGARLAGGIRRAAPRAQVDARPTSRQGSTRTWPPTSATCSGASTACRRT
jgi:hypothetical protein